MKRRMIAALPVLLAAAALATPAHGGHTPTTPDRLIASDQTFELGSNETRELVMPVQGLGVDWNVLIPCWGFSITGPGIDIAGANLQGFGAVIPEDPSLPDGGIPGAVRLADGSFATTPMGSGITAEVLRKGVNCRAVGWSFYGADGEPALDVFGNPKPAKASSAAATRKARAASKRRRARQTRRLSRTIVANAAVDGAVTVDLVGLYRPRIGSLVVLVRLRTGELPGRTVASLHARVLKQSPMPNARTSPASR